jgi:phosphoserine phosphatase
MTSGYLPVCVDLDGTLIRGDVTAKAVATYAKRNFFNVLRMFYWFLHGRAHLKHRLALEVTLDASSLEYNRDVLNFIDKKKAAGHKIFLATACNRQYAEEVADFLGIFDGVFASDRNVNLRAEVKAQALTTIFGRGGFIYVGNSLDDVKVWDQSAECLLVAPSRCVLKKMRRRKCTVFH